MSSWALCNTLLEERRLALAEACDVWGSGVLLRVRGLLQTHMATLQQVLEDSSSTGAGVNSGSITSSDSSSKRPRLSAVPAAQVTDNRQVSIGMRLGAGGGTGARAKTGEAVGVVTRHRSRPQTIHPATGTPQEAATVGKVGEEADMGVRKRHRGSPQQAAPAAPALAVLPVSSEGRKRGRPRKPTAAQETQEAQETHVTPAAVELARAHAAMMAHARSCRDRGRGKGKGRVRGKGQREIEGQEMGEDSDKVVGEGEGEEQRMPPRIVPPRRVAVPVVRETRSRGQSSSAADNATASASAPKVQGFTADELTAHLRQQPQVEGAIKNIMRQSGTGQAEKEREVGSLLLQLRNKTDFHGSKTWL